MPSPPAGLAAIALVVSDVDGTLVDRSKTLTPTTIAAVARLRAGGIGFTMISARPRSGLVALADTLDLPLPIGAFNGATLFRRGGDVLARHLIGGELVAAMLDMIGDAPVDRWIFAGDHWYATRADGPHCAGERVASGQQPIVTNNASPLYADTDKLTLVSDDAAMLAEVAARLVAAFGSHATIGQSQSYYLDVTAIAGNKGDGVTALAAAAGVPLASVAVIGDQANDLAMFARAGLSIAMGQAPDAVRAAANLITAANDADGVAAALDLILAARKPAAGVAER